MSTPRNGRIIAYPAEVLYDTDLLEMECFRMCDIATLAQAVLGQGISNSTLASGLNCTVQSPAALAVDIAPGSIYSLEDYDATQYGNPGLPADTTDMLYKQGINLVKTPITGLNPPGSGGDSIAYLIQAQFATIDNFPTARQYYNNNTPTAPITITNNSVRQDYVNLTKKTSAAAPVPTIPTPDAGFVGLWVVTVPFGATTVTSGMIAQYSSAPFISETLTQKVSYASLQNSSPIFGVDTGSVNSLVVTTSPAYVSIQAGTHIYVKVANTNTGSVVMNISSLGTINVVKYSDIGSVALSPGDTIGGGIYEFIYDGSNLQLLNPNSTSVMPTGSWFPYKGYTAPSGFLLLTPGATASRSTYANLLNVTTITQTATGSGTTTITGLTNAQSLFYVGMAVESSTLTAGTTVASIISNTSITLTNSTGTGSFSFQFFPDGNGDGTTTFTLPDPSRKAIIGAGGTVINIGTGTVGKVPGQTGGEEQHTPQVSETAGHNHTIGSPGNEFAIANAGAGVFAAGGTGGGTTITNSTGGGNAFNVMQPSYVSNFIIKT